ncbi:MAG: glycosyltransferase family 2 protein [Clostridia bacterium]|nr:glycosyltransferase family 2 protein [Clostridia bacterium]
MKLIIQIPCYNEEKTLPLVFKDLPKYIKGIDIIETQIIDDGSTDDTVKIAKSLGVDHVVKYVGNKGLARAFKTGVENALKHGADILVNTDGDNQYDSADIAKLVQPILDGKADIVIGDRQTGKIKHFSFIKRFFQWLGTRVTGFFAGQRMNDAVSGFRAYTREALIEINVVSEFSYVLDTTVQAIKKRLKIVHVPIRTNLPTRKSRLFKSIWEHMRRSAADLIRIYSLYEPFKVFLSLAVIFILLGTYPVARYLYFFFIGQGGGHVQSLIFGSILYIVGFQFLGLGILGEHMRINRKLIEDILKRLKK